MQQQQPVDKSYLFFFLPSIYLGVCYLRPAPAGALFVRLSVQLR